MSRVTVLSLLLFLILACGGAESIPGLYVSSTGQSEVRLDLKADGKGEWATDSDSIQVQWELRAGEVWLHTKAGGVIKGRIRSGALVFSLPGTPALVLERTGP